jgi:hypothetical protein
MESDVLDVNLSTYTNLWRVLLEKLIVTQIITKFLAFKETQKPIALSTRALPGPL